MALRVTMIAGLLLVLPLQPASAGLVKVTNMLAGSMASLEAKDKDGNTVASQFMTDTNADGQVEFGVENQDKVKDLVVWKTNTDGARIHYDAKFTTKTMSSLEPFELPTFAATDLAVALLAVVDVELFLTQVNPFTVGDLITVTDGTTALTDAILFKDFSGVPFPSPIPFDVSTIDALPNFTGSARVTAFDSVTPVPEPASLLFLASGAAGLALRTIWTTNRRRCRSS